MFTSYSNLAGLYVPVGLVVISLFLFLFTLLCYFSGFSKMAFPTLFFILATAIFGMIDGACSLYYNIGPDYPDYTVFLPAIFFSMIFGAFAWMSGITVFSVFFKEKKKTLIYLGYLVTLVVIVLGIVATVFYSKFSDDLSYIDSYKNVYYANIGINWVYFLLFIAIFVQTKASIPRLGKIVLLAFLVLNTITMIVNCASLVRWDAKVYLNAYAFISFFLTYFLCVISLLIIVIYWRKIASPNDQMNDS